MPWASRSACMGSSIRSWYSGTGRATDSWRASGPCAQPAELSLVREVMANGLSVRETERAVQEGTVAAEAETAAKPEPRRAAPLRPDDEALRRGLETALGLPVRLARNRRTGGRVVIDFLDDEDLNGLDHRLASRPLSPRELGLAE